MDDTSGETIDSVFTMVRECRARLRMDEPLPIELDSSVERTCSRCGTKLQRGELHSCQQWEHAPWWEDACAENMAHPERKPRAHGFVIR